MSKLVGVAGQEQGLGGGRGGATHTPPAVPTECPGGAATAAETFLCDFQREALCPPDVLGRGVGGCVVGLAGLEGNDVTMASHLTAGDMRMMGEKEPEGVESCFSI